MLSGIDHTIYAIDYTANLRYSRRLGSKTQDVYIFFYKTVNFSVSYIRFKDDRDWIPLSAFSCKKNLMQQLSLIINSQVFDTEMPSSCDILSIYLPQFFDEALIEEKFKRYSVVSQGAEYDRSILLSQFHFIWWLFSESLYRQQQATRSRNNGMWRETKWLEDWLPLKSYFSGNEWQRSSQARD